MSTKTVLLTGARAPVALDLAGSFTSAGYRVVCADSSPGLKASQAKYYTIHDADDPRFFEDLERIIAKEQVDVVIPVCEEVVYLSRLKLSAPVFAMPFESIDLLHNKWTFTKWLEENGFDAPRSFLVRLEADRDLLPDCKLIFKPIYSRFGHQVRVGNPSLEYEPSNPWIAQEFIEGDKLCSYSVIVDGVIKAHVSYRVLQSMGMGAGIAFENVDDPEITKFVERFASRFGFSGQVSFDFIRGSKLYCIECNPRATSGVHWLKSPELAKSFFTDVYAAPCGYQVFRHPGVSLWYGIKQGDIFTQAFWRVMRCGSNPLTGHTGALKALLNVIKNSGLTNMAKGLEYNGGTQCVS